MKLLEHISLKGYNTFGINVTAKYFATFNSVDGINELIEFNKPSTSNRQRSTLILGGGSNILFTKDYDGLVMKNEMTGIHEVKEDLHHIYVHVGAGEDWHGFVEHCLHNNWAGVENLALIPGNVGASPMQNIGAYGVEVKNVIHAVEAFHIGEKKIHIFSVNDCVFGYRDSIFKNKLRNEFVITGVTFRLNKKPVFNISYGAIDQELERMGVKELSIQSIAQAIINIRSSKLPDPKVMGNAGSFFKNPHVTVEAFRKLKEDFPKIVGYVQENGEYKLAAGWMIEYCGWKGFRRGDAGCHSWQSLVLVNYGNASGKEILDLSEEILQSVKEKFSVVLEREVNII